MSASAAADGDKYLAEAEKALKRTTLFGFGKSQKYQDAAEAFTKAGIKFKLATLWDSAGAAYTQAAECLLTEGEVYDGTSKLVEAGNCFKKSNPVKAIKTFNRVIDLNNEAGKFAQSARYYQEVAEIYEADENTKGALEAYQQAANLLIGERTQYWDCICEERHCSTTAYTSRSHHISRVKQVATKLLDT